MMSKKSFILILVFGFLTTALLAQKTGHRAEDAFVLRSGDAVSVVIVPKGNMPDRVKRTVTIRPDGKINLPLLGDVKIAGFTPAEVDSILTKKLEAFLTTVDVTINVTSFAGHRYYVVGEVRNPGYYQLGKPITVLDAVQLAGGATRYASLNHVKIVRGDLNHPTILKVKLKNIQFKGNLRTNLLLQNGDVVVIPPNSFARVGYFFRKILFPFRDVIALALSVLGTLYFIGR
ncbi:MAG TPA: hypothetical protein ENH53_01490 [Bacteroidetes bacterium]|nr:hypothetical protein [Bacteroidota bacterium]